MTSDFWLMCLFFLIYFYFIFVACFVWFIIHGAIRPGFLLVGSVIGCDISLAHMVYCLLISAWSRQPPGAIAEGAPR